MDDMIGEFKGATGSIELYKDRVVILHHGIGARMNGCNKKDNIIIYFAQIERIQFKSGSDGGFIQFTIKDSKKVFNDIHDLTKDENCITFGVIANKEAKQFKYQLAQLIPDKPINILKKTKDIQQFNPAIASETVIESKPMTLKEKRAAFQRRARKANPKAFGDIVTENEKQAIKNEPPKENKTVDNQNVAYCPKCGSTSLSTIKVNYHIGTAIICAIIFGALGSLFGPIGIIVGIILGIISGAPNSKTRLICLKCGHKFYPGKK